MIIETRERINGYRVPPCDVAGMGDWQGEEERAARRFVRLCEIIAESLPDGQAGDLDEDDGEVSEGFSRGVEALRRQERYELEILDSAMAQWGTSDALLTATDEEFRAWAKRYMRG